MLAMTSFPMAASFCCQFQHSIHKITNDWKIPTKRWPILKGVTYVTGQMVKNADSAMFSTVICDLLNWNSQCPLFNNCIVLQRVNLYPYIYIHCRNGALQHQVLYVYTHHCQISTMNSNQHWWASVHIHTYSNTLQRIRQRSSAVYVGMVGTIVCS